MATYTRHWILLLAELNDGHTGMLAPSVRSGRRYFATGRDIGGAIVVDKVGAPGLILDLRGNGGGSTLIYAPIAGRFFSQPFTYGRDYFRARLPQRGWRAHFDYRVKPRGHIYAGPVVLLIDEGVFSTAENFTVALLDSGRAMAVGRQTAGGSGNPISFNLPGDGRARFSTGDFRRNSGARIEGAGIMPDVYVTWTVEDFCAGRDPDLDAAERILLER